MNLDELLQQEEKAIRKRVESSRNEALWHQSEAERYQQELVEQGKLHEELVTLLIDRNLTPLPE